MRLVLIACVLISTGVVAQESPLQSPNPDPNPNSTRPMNYQGCVIRLHGTVMLTDASSRDYKLVSHRGELASYVGQEVQVVGTLRNPVDPSCDEMSGLVQRNEPASLDVEYIAKAADHCSSIK
jgi:hypothetical protein